MTRRGPVIAEPTAIELLEGVSAWLDGGEDAPAGGFARRVARNALAIVARELARGPAMERAATERLGVLLGTEGNLALLQSRLVASLRDGSIAPDDPALLDHLARTALDTLAIDQPRYAHELTDMPT